MKKIIAACVLSLIAFAAQAERADSLKQAKLTAVTVDSDQVSGKTVAVGDVVIERGTLLIKSDKAVLSETPEGYMAVTLTSGPGKFATFRQKRDGGPDLWVEGQASRIEYDERTEIVKLFNNAVVKQLENGKLTNEMDGEFISYDNRKEVAALRNDASGESKQGTGRTTVIFQPHRTPAAAPAPAGK